MEIYFHDARWAMTYRSNGSILEFEKPGVIAGSNRRLERMSEIFIEVMEPHRILRPSDSLVVGDEAHRWEKRRSIMFQNITMRFGPKSLNPQPERIFDPESRCVEDTQDLECGPDDRIYPAA